MNRPVALFLILQPALALAQGANIVGRVEAEGGLAESTTVYLETAPQAAAPKSAAHATERTAITQKNSAFTPVAAVVRAGEPLAFPNEDKIYHNVFSLSPGNEFDLGLYRGGVSKTTALKAGEVDVYCNIHPDMVAKLLVIDHDYFARVSKDGSYTLSGVAPGTYMLVAWSPAHEPVKKQIVVEASGPARAEFKLKARASAKAHLNKNGEQYGRYK